MPTNWMTCSKAQKQWLRLLNSKPCARVCSPGHQWSPQRSAVIVAVRTNGTSTRMARFFVRIAKKHAVCSYRSRTNTRAKAAMNASNQYQFIQYGVADGLARKSSGKEVNCVCIFRKITGIYIAKGFGMGPIIRQHFLTKGIPFAPCYCIIS